MDKTKDKLKLLGIYLNDHRLGAAAATEVARRCQASNDQTPLGLYLEEFISELHEDRSALDDALSQLGLAKDPLKPALGWVAEKLGRLKLNGRVLSYSPLSRVLELEGLHLGVDGKRSLWEALKELKAGGLGIALDFDALIARAERQQANLEEHRREAVLSAFSVR